jgi:hypothetical protein
METVTKRTKQLEFKVPNKAIAKGANLGIAKPDITLILFRIKTRIYHKFMKNQTITSF